MSDAQFDVEAVFDASDYPYFYGAALTPERTEREIELIWRLLELQPGMAVLDLACGHGRIANGLARRGCQVTGLDITPAFLEQARQEAATFGVQVDYLQGDMRALPWTERFDRIINWFTAYGYFSDADNRLVLAEAQRALKLGGRLLLELNNREYVLRHYQHATIVEREGNYMLDRVHYDMLTGRNHVERTIIREGQMRQMRFSVRFFTYPELATWLEQAGFGHVAGYNEAGQVLTLESRRMIVMAEKEPGEPASSDATRRRYVRNGEQGGRGN